MSELTKCNFCTLKDIKRRAKENGMRVTVLADAAWMPDGMPKGVNVYVHPKDIKIVELEGGEDGERKNYRKSWMMGISKECCC